MNEDREVFTLMFVTITFTTVIEIIVIKIDESLNFVVKIKL
jgi:hypothetical protein